MCNMQGLKITILCFVLVGEVTSQTCNDAKLAECKKLKDAAINMSSNQTAMCMKVTEFDTCVTPCKGLTESSPLFQQYNEMYSGITALVNVCKCHPAVNCLAAMTTVKTLNETCKAVAEASACVGKYNTSCNSDPSFISAINSLQTYKSQCSGCDMGGLLQCNKDFEDVSDTAHMCTDFPDFCLKKPAFEACIAQKLPACKASNNMAVRYVEMTKNMLELLCVKEKAEVEKQSSTTCFQAVCDDMEMKCSNTSTPEMTENNMFKEESEKEQCKRIADHTSCVKDVVSAKCDEKTTALTVRLSVGMLKIFYNKQDIECVTGGVANVVALTWITVSSALVALILITTEGILMKLGRDEVLKAPYK